MLLLGIYLSQLPGNAQQTFILTGRVSDENNHFLPAATVTLNPGSRGAVCNAEGVFVITDLKPGEYELVASFLGYNEYYEVIKLKGDMNLSIQLSANAISLQEVVVSSMHIEQRKKEEPLAIEIVNEHYIKQNLGGSLMQSLERLPGVTTIDIGSGQSKPVIRGLGFNRVVVVENGIKHEAQQWGADHGLEIDQYATNNIEVIKGPASLTYGSDAIGGIINVKNNEIPKQHSLEGMVDLTAKSNNNLLGSSFSLSGRKNWLHGEIRATVLSYGDYRVPVDTVEIYPDTYSYKVALHNRRMRNTAGYEHNYHGNIGIIKENFSSRIYASQTNSKGGFFANAHGLEPLNVDPEPYDKSDRDIQLPYYNVSHYKVSNKTNWRSDNINIEFNVGYQHNFRQEWSKYTTHGYMPPAFPDTLPYPQELDREFKKDYYSANIKIEYSVSEKLSLSSGANTDYHQNRINGRGFIIPAYKQSNIGGFLLGKYNLSGISLIRAGIRYDFGYLFTQQHNDWYLSPVVEENDTTYQYLIRANEIERNFSSISWSIGYNYTPQNWIIKFNVGKSFRMPTPKELAANGINYHYFRYEVGNAEMSPEVSWQFDAGFEYSAKRFVIGTSPFVNLFSNYIYLNPSSVEGGYQKFNYTQSRVFRHGTEIHTHYYLLDVLRFGCIGEYVYSLQLSGEKEGFTLPYSPPPSAIINLRYQKAKLSFAENVYFSADYRLTAAQNNIVPPEDPTPAHALFNLGLGGNVKFKNQKLNVNMQVQNLFNTAYLNHTSFYRLMNVPEPGRNFVLNISIPFSSNLNTNSYENKN